MNDNQNSLQNINEIDPSELNLDDLEASLDADLENSLADLELLKEDREKIGSPSALSETVMNVVWEQVVIQIGKTAGDEFVKENVGLEIDLRPSSHFQTTKNFAEGKIASRNPYIDYQDRYDNWQKKLSHDDNGNVRTYVNRAGKSKPILAGEHVRKPFDKNRPTGSVEKGTDMDHTVSADEIICDPQANAHLTEEKQISFANSKANLKEMNAKHNRSKGPNSMSDWLDNPNANGQKPDEVFDDLSEELKEEYRENDRVAREEYKNVKQKGVQESIRTGVKSMAHEAGRMKNAGLKAIAMTLLAALVKEIFQKFAVWLKSKKKDLSSFLSKVKEAITNFVSNLMQHIKTAMQSAVGAIASIIFGPIVQVVQKAWTFLKQGYKSFKQSIDYIKDPETKKQPLSITMMVVGKIIVTGLAATGSLVLGEVVEKALSSTGFMTFTIPGIGSLASILGIFIGALVSGIIGAIALNMIDRKIAKKQKSIVSEKIIDAGNKVLNLQNQKINVSQVQLQNKKVQTGISIGNRHEEAADLVSSGIQAIKDDLNTIIENGEQVSSDNSSSIDKTNEDNSNEIASL